jgi:catechol 2,3-dioxygenase-like lactoylglutathione lyase family enzyme
MIRKITAMLAAFAFVIGAVGPAMAQTRPGSATLRQITLLVEDMDRSVDFYQRLGLSKVADKTSDSAEAAFDPAELPLTADSKSSRHVVLKGAADSGLISLLNYDHPRLSSARGSLGGLGTGDVIISIEVPDIQEAYRRLSQIGTRFQRTPYKATAMAADGSRQAAQRMLAFDPDGHLAEIVQIGGK